MRRGGFDGAARAAVLSNLGNLYAGDGVADYTAALRCHRRAPALRERSGDLRDQAQSLANLGHVHYQRNSQDDLAAATRSYERALGLFREADDAHGEAWTAYNLGGLVALRARSARRGGLRPVGRAGRHWRGAVRLLESRGLRPAADRIRDALGGLRPGRGRGVRIASLAGSAGHTFGVTLPAVVVGAELLPDAADHSAVEHHPADFLTGLGLPADSGGGLVAEVIEAFGDPVPDFGTDYVSDRDAAPDYSGGGGGGDAGGGDHDGHDDHDHRWD